MDNRTNTIAGWVLAAAAAALGLGIASSIAFHGGEHDLEKVGYPVEGVADDSGDAGPKEVPLATLLASADPAKGAEIFKKCQACHTIAQGAPNGLGPNLYATLGEEIAHGKNGFAFSDALKKVGGTWGFENMNKWLTSPRKFAPGTKMSFAGLSKPEDRADLLVYLNSQGSNLPLPTPPAPAADAAAGDNATAAAAGNVTDGNGSAPLE